MEEFQRKPDNNLVWAILCTIFCCLPLGIVAIVNSSKVDGLFAAGDYRGAEEAAAKAKKFALIGTIIGAVAILLYIIVYVVILGAAFSSFF